MKLQPIGILGGTFDPVHYGHLRAAEAAMQRLGLVEVRFVPNRIPPHKPNQRVSPEADRLAMLELALAEYPRFAVDTLELHRSGPSYTFDTICELRRQHPDWQIYFVLGADGFLDLRTWHRWEELLRLCCIAVVARPGHDGEGYAAMLRELGPELAAQVVYLAVPGIDVASSRIRELAAQGEALTGLVPESVAAYIRTKRLYQQPGE